MRVKPKYKPLAFACGLSLLFSFACQREELKPEQDMTDDRITFYIVDPNEPSTKSSEVSQIIALEVGGEKN